MKLPRDPNTPFLVGVMIVFTVVHFGCQQDQHFAEVDDCFCQVVAMQFQLQPTDKRPIAESEATEWDNEWDVNETLTEPKQSAAAEGESATAVHKGSVPPAADPPNVVVYATTNCAACKWLTQELSKAGVKHSYVILGNNEIEPGQAYPHGLINGKPANYQELKSLLKVKQ
jgi:hypothetical protein